MKRPILEATPFIISWKRARKKIKRKRFRVYNNFIQQIAFLLRCGKEKRALKTACRNQRCDIPILFRLVRGKKDLSLNRIENAIVEAIKEYNRYRSPEATAELIALKDREMRVRFTGPFCSSCGIPDYFEDLIYILKRFITRDWKITFVEESSEGFIITYGLIK